MYAGRLDDTGRYSRSPSRGEEEIDKGASKDDAAATAFRLANGVIKAAKAATDAASELPGAVKDSDCHIVHAEGVSSERGWCALWDRKPDPRISPAALAALRPKKSLDRLGLYFVQ